MRALGALVFALMIGTLVLPVHATAEVARRQAAAGRGLGDGILREEPRHRLQTCAVSRRLNWISNHAATVKFRRVAKSC